MRSRAGLASSDLGSSNRGLGRSGQPAFSYKYNENFMRKEGMCQASPVKRARARFSKGPVTLRVRRQIFEFDSCIVSFTLILNAKTTRIRQVFGPEKLSGLSRNGPQSG